MSNSVIAIFDIGKTNKKFFLFDDAYHVVEEKSEQFAEIADEDGDPCEDITSLTQWVHRCLASVYQNQAVVLKAINFSTYGASFVHINGEGQIAAPLYNYLKPYPAALEEQFFNQYGGAAAFSRLTASPVLGSLNAGLQLYRLKYEKPVVFQQIRYALHLPQYMSFSVTGRLYSDITSIGCHTGLWNFPENHYHEWIFHERINEKLAPIHPSDRLFQSQWQGHAIKTGVGLHDSSAALIPYLVQYTEPFLLLSTGTWCISLNPFNQTALTAAELSQDCLCYMEYRGRPVKASRLFAGNEHEQQVKKLSDYYSTTNDYYKSVQYNPDLITGMPDETIASLQKTGGSAMQQDSVFGLRDLSLYSSYEAAYHRLMMDLVSQQEQSIQLVVHNSPVKNIYVDGGFSRNTVFMNLLAKAYPDCAVYAASIAQASALGAALAVHRSWNVHTAPAGLVDLTHFPLIPQ